MELRGYEIARSRNSGIKKNRLGWRVPSQSGNGTYRVVLEDGRSACSCPDFEIRQDDCKHIFAVRFSMKAAGATSMAEPATKKATYSQNWPAYNAAQVNEKRQFQILLHDLCRGIPRASRVGRGRPPIRPSDAIFSAVYKVYSTVSGRRFMSDLQTAHEAGYVSRVPCFNSIFRVFSSERTASILNELISASALPMKALESKFACDSSGFSSSRFDRWFDHKHGKQRMSRRWVKAHLMCGVNTNVVTALEIHGQNAQDAPIFPALMETTGSHFHIDEVSADKGYISLKNLQTAVSAGAVPLIPFRNGMNPGRGGLWAKMYHFYNLHQEEFLQRYHLRSNVEATFAMIKAKFGDSVRSKTETAMKNEVRAKVLAHNICVLIQSMHEFGIDPNFG